MFKKMLRKWVGPWLVDDIIHRLRLLHDPYMLGANRLNLLKHLLDGYTVENNQPSVGYIRWTNLHIVYAGNDYTIQDGNTNKQYVWWDYSVSTTILQTSDTLPDLDEEDIIVFLNKNGTHVTVPITTVLDGSLIVTESVLTDALSANCVTSEKIEAGAVITEKLAVDSVVATKIKADEVQTIHLKALNVTTDKIANEATIIRSYAYTEGDVDVVTACASGEDLIQSATIYSKGNPVHISFCAKFNKNAAGTATVTVKVKRSVSPWTVVWQKTISVVYGTEASVDGQVIHTPGASNGGPPKGYSFVACTNASCTANSRFLMLEEYLGK